LLLSSGGGSAAKRRTAARAIGRAAEGEPSLIDRLLLGISRYVIPIPHVVWKPVMKAAGRKARAGLSFMSEDHHRVRDFAVLELPRNGAPLSPATIAEALDLSLPRVRSILDELEEHLTFLFRNDGEEVTWAYPVTVDETPHHASFSSGEEAYSP
jgi:hypothetical protein